MTYFEKRPVSLSWKFGEWWERKWLINLYKNRPHAGIFPFALILCDIWAYIYIYIYKALCAEPAGADFKNAWGVDLNYILQLYFYFYVIFIFHFFFLAYPLFPSVCPGKNVACGTRTIPIHLNGKKGKTFLWCDLKWALWSLGTWESTYVQIDTWYIMLNIISYAVSLR